MSAQLKALYDLQVIDLDLAKCLKAKASLDDGTAKKQQVEAAKQDAQQAEKSLHEATTELQDKDLNLKTIETKRKTFKDKLYGGKVTNPKELDSMEKEIEMLGRQKDKLEERILELYDIVEERKGVLAEKQAVVKQQEEELAAYLAKLKQDRAALDARIKELAGVREQALPEVDAALLKKYETARARNPVVVSKVDGDQCTACHTQIMAGWIKEIKLDKVIKTCENCGRMLYLETE